MSFSPTGYIPYPSYPHWRHHSNCIRRRVQEVRNLVAFDSDFMIHTYTEMLLNLNLNLNTRNQLYILYVHDLDADHDTF